MNSSLQKALSHLTEQENIDAVSVTYLENLVNKYPYFPIAHILLSKKLKAEGSKNYVQQVQKTALYFDNPYWLYYQLAPAIPEIVFGDNANDAFEKPLTSSKTEDDLQVIPDQLHPEPEVLQEEIESGEPFPYASTEQDFNPGVPTEITPSDTEPSNAAEEAEQTDLTTQEITSSEDGSNIEVPKPVSISEEELEEDEKLIHEIAHTDTKAPGAEVETHSSKEEDADPALEEKVTSALEGHHAFSKDIEERTRALVHPRDAAGTSDDQVIFYEPYHTIDYFASQGIQLVLENNPQDKLGKQLKKFTQWLKHMKRLGPEDALNAVKDSHLENTMQGIADSSNTPRDVVTETMASVLEKQGKTEKAIELYTKLTFLNPDKSAYFADKIQKLKEI